RILIALILSTAVLFFYPYAMKRFFPAAINAEKTTPKAQGEAGKEAVPPSVRKEGVAANTIELLKSEELVKVETPLYRAVFSTVGGGVRSWELKKYSESLIKKESGINIADTISRNGSFKTQVLTNGALEDISFTPSSVNLNIDNGGDSELVFRGNAGTGLSVEKKYRFTGSSYMINVELKIVNSSKTPFAGAVQTPVFAAVAGTDSTGYHQGPVVYYAKDTLVRPTVKEPRLTGGELKWIGLESKYFLVAILVKPDSGFNWTTDVAGAASSSAKLEMPLNLNPGGQMVYAYTEFMGPKEYDLLLTQKAGLEESIEFGRFGFFAKPLLVILNFFERYLRNYGLAIVMLTVIIKALFYPLTKYSLKSMKDMQRMQPQLAALKEKYKDNKEKMNKELMELYKRYKINPLSGCLPMVLQIPVFIALYEVLYVAIELRHAPLFLWIQDLSAMDPYYITPLIMGVTMFVQQKMTPSTADPAQARIMMFMPIIFTFMFLKFP
ncbi:MAG: membrane protein insertase YidC, partial [Deltaproteobacteria bacterium]